MRELIYHLGQVLTSISKASFFKLTLVCDEVAQTLEHIVIMNLSEIALICLLLSIDEVLIDPVGLQYSLELHKLAASLLDEVNLNEHLPCVLKWLLSIDSVDQIFLMLMLFG